MKILGREMKASELPTRTIKYIGRKLLSKPIRWYKDEQAIKILSRWKEKRTDVEKKVKVGFIVQVPEIWEKEAPIYEKMLQDSRFNPILIIVPPMNVQSGSLLQYGDELAYFRERYSKEEYILAVQDGKSVDFSNLDCDYIFYQRPYNAHMPSELKSEQVFRHSKICYIPYGRETLKSTVQYNDDFFRNAYLTFLAGKEELSFFEGKFVKSRKMQLQHFLWKGYPVFEKSYKSREKCEEVHILWTPRWNYDPQVGGSHFLEYRSVFFKIKKLYPEVKVTLRPHPLMWDYLKREGFMSENEIENYKKKMDNEGLEIDSVRFFEESMRDKTILITDISSIIPEYFLTGRPIIYCPAQMPLNSFYCNILEGTYVANTEDEMLSHLSSLIQGEDYMKEERERIIKENFEYLDSATKNIIETIYADYIGEEITNERVY